MKSKIILTFLFVFFCKSVFAQNLNIKSKNITLDKKREISIFKNEVVIKTLDNNIIKSDYAEYNKKQKIIILKNNITAIDNQNNIIKTNYAEYDEINQLLKSKGPTKIITSQKFVIDSRDIIFDNKNNLIKSDYETILRDTDKNKISLSNFEYQNKSNIFKAIGEIKIIDKLQNSYELSQIYIDTNKKEIVGTDIKAFINQEDFKIDKSNKPRILSNTINIKDNITKFEKGVFTMCNYRKGDKCPPWSIQSDKILHDNIKKTIYYDNAVIKIYDVPIFYLPRFSHPDPSVKRKSGFLNPSFLNSSNLGRAISAPYFFDIDEDKDLTLNTKMYAQEHPLILGEYRQVFKNSKAIIDVGYTEGYKNTSKIKKAGEKSHFFSKLEHNFKRTNGSKNYLEIKLQDVSNDKFFKLYKIETDQVAADIASLENSILFTHEKDDLFLSMTTASYETLDETYNDKYEYIYPEIELRKNLFNNNKIGNIDLDTNFKIHNKDTNKTSKFLVNNLDWDYKNFNFDTGFRGKLFSKLKNVNYETKNIEHFKNEPSAELFGAFGYLTELDLIKETNKQTKHYLSPKFLLRYSPGQMKKETDGEKLNLSNVFSLNRSSKNENFENGLNAAIGFDYELDNDINNFKLSMGQVINEKENTDMSSISSLDEKLSDLVGFSSLEINQNLKLEYNFLIDQNYEDFNYNEIGAEIDFKPFTFELDYIKESKHIGNDEYAYAGIGLSTNKNSFVKLKSKRNLVTNSSEYYDLSYEYFNDCLRAGIVYRREFYLDSEIEPENSLMFRISLFPDGSQNNQLLD
ncbi:LPS export ABC transporter periplasmic protein LptC [Pelagibacteraceae bacterium]|nr:LPS export ABC transporter periplasmic protein LptC [Pelagibacteraceae bacterium]